MAENGNAQRDKHKISPSLLFIEASEFILKLEIEPINIFAFFYQKLVLN